MILDCVFPKAREVIGKLCRGDNDMFHIYRDLESRTAFIERIALLLGAHKYRFSFLWNCETFAMKLDTHTHILGTISSHDNDIEQKTKGVGFRTKHRHTYAGMHPSFKRARG